MLPAKFELSHESLELFEKLYYCLLTANNSLTKINILPALQINLYKIDLYFDSYEKYIEDKPKHKSFDEISTTLLKITPLILLYYGRQFHYLELMLNVFNKTKNSILSEIISKFLDDINQLFNRIKLLTIDSLAEKTTEIDNEITFLESDIKDKINEFINKNKQNDKATLTNLFLHAHLGSEYQTCWRKAREFLYLDKRIKFLQQTKEKSMATNLNQIRKLVAFEKKHSHLDTSLNNAANQLLHIALWKNNTSDKTSLKLMARKLVNSCDIVDNLNEDLNVTSRKLFIFSRLKKAFFRKPHFRPYTCKAIISADQYKWDLTPEIFQQIFSTRIEVESPITKEILGFLLSNCIYNKTDVALRPSNELTDYIDSEYATTTKNLQEIEHQLENYSWLNEVWILPLRSWRCSPNYNVAAVVVKGIDDMTAEDPRNNQYFTTRLSPGTENFAINSLTGIFTAMDTGISTLFGFEYGGSFNILYNFTTFLLSYFNRTLIELGDYLHLNKEITSYIEQKLQNILHLGLMLLMYNFFFDLNLGQNILIGITFFASNFLQSFLEIVLNQYIAAETLNSPTFRLLVKFPLQRICFWTGQNIVAPLAYGTFFHPLKLESKDIPKQKPTFYQNNTFPHFPFKKPQTGKPKYYKDLRSYENLESLRERICKAKPELCWSNSTSTI